MGRRRAQGGFSLPQSPSPRPGEDAEGRKHSPLVNPLPRMTLGSEACTCYWWLLWSRVGTEDKDEKRKNQAQQCKLMDSTKIKNSTNLRAATGFLVANDHAQAMICVRDGLLRSYDRRFGSLFLHPVDEDCAKLFSRNFSFNPFSRGSAVKWVWGEDFNPAWDNS